MAHDDAIGEGVVLVSEPDNRVDYKLALRGVAALAPLEGAPGSYLARGDMSTTLVTYDMATSWHDLIYNDTEHHHIRLAVYRKYVIRSSDPIRSRSYRFD